MSTENNLEIRKFIIDNDIIFKGQLDLNKALEFLVSQNFEMYLKGRNISCANQKIYSLFSANYKEHICNNKGNIYCAYLNKEIVGIIYINSQFYIDSLYVREEYRKNGIGKHLIKLVLNEFKGENITLTSSKDALNFYRNLDFIEQERPKKEEKFIRLIYTKK